MKNEPHSPVSAPQPIEGEAIPCSKYAALIGFLAGIMEVTIGIGFLLFALAIGANRMALLSSIWIVTGGLSLFCSFYFVTHQERLILGDERIQYLRGRRVLFEIPYDNIAEVKLFAPRSLMRCLGINLVVPEAFDQAWPRIRRRRKWTRKLRGFDLIFPTLLTGEHPERLLEVVLICYHRFKANEADKVIT